MKKYWFMKKVKKRCYRKSLFDILSQTIYCERMDVGTSVTSKKSPNVYLSCPIMISLDKLKMLIPLQELPKNVGHLDKLIVATGFEKLPKVQ